MPKQQPKELPMSEVNKDRTLFALIGVLAGFTLGFFTAYSLLKPGAPGAAGTAAIPPAVAESQTPAASPSDQPGLVMTDSEAKILTDAADRMSDDFDLQMNSGNQLYAAKRYHEAAKLFERAHQLKPDDAHPLVHLANAYYDAQEWVKAGESYERALVIDPNDVNVRTDYGLTFWFRTPSQPEKAVEQYRKSLAIDPSHMQTLQNMAIAQIDGLKDAKGGADTIARLERVSSGNPVLAGLKERLKAIGGQ